MARTFGGKGTARNRAGAGVGSTWNDAVGLGLDGLNFVGESEAWCGWNWLVVIGMCVATGIVLLITEIGGEDS